MLDLFLWVAAGLIAVAFLDRLFLAAESRGWIHYRRHGFGRPGSIYHLNELSETFGAGKLPAIEEQLRQDESGDPLGPRPEPNGADWTATTSGDHLNSDG